MPRIGIGSLLVDAVLQNQSSVLDNGARIMRAFPTDSSVLASQIVIDYGLLTFRQDGDLTRAFITWDANGVTTDYELSGVWLKAALRVKEYYETVG